MGKGANGIALNKVDENAYAKQQAPTTLKQFDSAPFNSAATSGQKPEGMVGSNQYDKILAYLMQMGNRG